MIRLSFLFVVFFLVSCQDDFFSLHYKVVNSLDTNIKVEIEGLYIEGSRKSYHIDSSFMVMNRSNYIFYKQDQLKGSVFDLEQPDFYSFEKFTVTIDSMQRDYSKREDWNFEIVSDELGVYTLLVQ